MPKDAIGKNSGQWYTECGRLPNGKQPRFLFGTVHSTSIDAARLRRARIRALWQRCQEQRRDPGTEGVWTPKELGWARHIAKGATTLSIYPDGTDDEAEVYTDRNYGKVFAAQKKVYDCLKPMFSSEPSTKSKTYIGLKKVDAIRAMWADGAKFSEIMATMKVSKATAYRHRPLVAL